MSSVLEMILKNPVGTGEGRSQQFTARVHCDLSLWRPRGRVGKYTERTLQISKGMLGSQSSRGQVVALTCLFSSQEHVLDSQLSPYYFPRHGLCLFSWDGFKWNTTIVALLISMGDVTPFAPLEMELLCPLGLHIQKCNQISLVAFFQVTSWALFRMRRVAVWNLSLLTPLGSVSTLS